MPLGPLSEKVGAFFDKEGIKAGTVDFHTKYNLDSCTASVTTVSNLPEIDINIKGVGLVKLSWDIYADASAEWVECPDKPGCHKCVVELHYSVTRRLTVAGVTIPWKAVPEKGGNVVEEIAEGSCVPEEEK